MTKEEYIDVSEYGYDADKGIWSKHWEKFLVGYVHPNGYVQVTLKCIDGKQRHFQLHRALWYIAYGPIPDGYEINHLDECPQNNRLSNLEIVTHIQNCNYATRNERIAAKHKGVPMSEEAKAKMRGRKLSEEHKAKISIKQRGVPNPKVAEALRGRKLSEEVKRKISSTLTNGKTSKAVVAVDEDNNIIYEFPSTQEAERNGFYSSAVVKCCNNCFNREGNKYYKGLRWFYKSDWEKLIYEQRETNCIAERNR